MTYCADAAPVVSASATIAKVRMRIMEVPPVGAGAPLGVDHSAILLSCPRQARQTQRCLPSRVLPGFARPPNSPSVDRSQRDGEGPAIIGGVGGYDTQNAYPIGRWFKIEIAKELGLD